MTNEEEAFPMCLFRSLREFFGDLTPLPPQPYIGIYAFRREWGSSSKNVPNPLGKFTSGMPQEEKEHPFYGIDIIRRKEQHSIERLLKKYRHEAVSEELKEKIWEELQMEKYKGNITIPFKVVLRRDVQKKFPDVIEVILDTKI